jgi:hypothetical protein
MKYQKWNPFILALLLPLAAYGGTALIAERFANKPASEDRGSFCELDWIIEDFENAFISAYFDLMMAVTAERAKHGSHMKLYADWLRSTGASASAESQKAFEQECGPMPMFDPGSVSKHLEETLAKLQTSQLHELLVRDSRWLQEMSAATQMKTP